MTTYEFTCPDCETTKTLEWPIGQTLPNPTCPKCSKTMPQKFFPTPTHLKGPGFYKTTKKQ